jgi:hypothetical protein
MDGEDLCHEAVVVDQVGVELWVDGIAILHVGEIKPH